MAADDEDVLRAAWYYYGEDRTQQEISVLLGTSRATVGRLLERARREGLVQITLDPRVYSAFGGSAELKRRFGLSAAVVVPTTAEDGAGVTQRLAEAGGRYLASILRPGQTLAVGWGNTPSRALLAVPREVLTSVRLVTLTGGVDPYLRAQVSSAETAPGGLSLSNMIPAPMLASSPALAEALLDESSVRTPLTEARLADHALVGIGSVSPDATLVQIGYQTAQEVEMHARQGVVGDMLGRFYLADGTVADLPVHRRIIGTDLDELRSMRNVIAIAGGTEKAAAILGALRGGYLDVLITDTTTAALVLDGA
jgi:lsr operon transcriptional repressor